MKRSLILLALALGACAQLPLQEARLQLPTASEAGGIWTFRNDGPETALLVEPRGARISGPVRVAAGQAVEIEWHGDVIATRFVSGE